MPPAQKIRPVRAVLTEGKIRQAGIRQQGLLKADAEGTDFRQITNAFCGNRIPLNRALL